MTTLVEREQLTLQDYKQFFEDTPLALIRTDIRTGEILMANRYAAQMFGYDSVEDFKANVKTVDLYSPDERKALIRALKKSGTIENYEIELKLPNKTLWVSARLHLNCGGTCIEGSLMDITELVKMRNSQLSLMKEVGKKLDRKLAALVG